MIASSSYDIGARGRAHPRIVGLMVFVLGLLLIGAGSAFAHPLGNFTTNTAWHLTIAPDHADVIYVVDFAEIPALKVRQSLGAPSGSVPDAAANPWRDEQCRLLGANLHIVRDGTENAVRATTARVSFPPGQAGLTTLRLECEYQTDWAVADRSVAVTLRDDNFSDRIGWKEITAEGDRVQIAGDVGRQSLTNLLRSYPKGAVSSPSRQQSAAFTTQPGPANVRKTGQTVVAGSSSRGNDGLTQRFQSLLATQNITLPFALAALVLALFLGGLHAMAPGHGKTIMAAYAVSRRGSKRDILTIGATVATTHTIGVVVLGVLVSATSAVSPDRTLKWASVASGLLVIGVGITLVRSRLRAWRIARPGQSMAPTDGRRRPAGDNDSSRLPHDDHPHPHDDHPHPHDDHGHDDHAHDDHAHPHDEHGHGDHAHDDHAHPHDEHGHGDQTQLAHPDDSRFVVTSHAHGGWSHQHVLPAPGALVRRRELVVMGLAGGLVPSPSALVVLLGAIALRRITFGVALVVAYGLGLAATLIGAGLLLVRFESGIRGWATRRDTPLGARFAKAINVLPLISGFAIGGAGLLLVIRSVARL